MEGTAQASGTPTATTRPVELARREVASLEEEELLTVIVPCYNEVENVAHTVRQVVDEIPRIPMPVEILLVDDGSTDGTREAMEGLVEEFEFCRMLVNPRNLGVGATVLRAVEEIPPDSWVTIFPGDNELLFSSIQNHLEARHDHDLIMGYLQNPIIRPLRRRIASMVFLRFINFLYGFSYRYLNGMKLFRARLYRGIEVVGQGHAFMAELLAKIVLRDPGIRIGEVPFAAKGRATGRSKAIRLGSILMAVKETFVGYRSVARYRDRMIQSPPADPSSR